MFAVLPRGRNSFEILKKFLAIPLTLDKKTVADIQFEGELITPATEQAPNLNFAETKTNSCCKKAVGSTSINPTFKILVAKESCMSHQVRGLMKKWPTLFPIRVIMKFVQKFLLIALTLFNAKNISDGLRNEKFKFH